MLTKKEYFKMVNLIGDIGAMFASADVIWLLIVMTVMCAKGITSPPVWILIFGFSATISHIIATFIVDKIFEYENEKYIIEEEG